jgi:serine protease inhibitor
MVRVLGLTGLGLQEVNAANAAFLSMQNALDPKVHLAVANSIWAASGIELAPDFVQRIRDYHAGDVANVEFGQPGAADIINKWVASKTNDKIRRVVTPEVVRSSILILINAIYFKGIWMRQFDEENTEERAFINGGLHEIRAEQEVHSPSF